MYSVRTAHPESLLKSQGKVSILRVIISLKDLKVYKESTYAVTVQMWTK